MDTTSIVADRGAGQALTVWFGDQLYRPAGAGVAGSDLAQFGPASPDSAVTAALNPFILIAMDVCLIVPGSLATISGGLRYDRCMADGLRALGHTVRVAELDGNLPDPDQPAIYAARTLWSALPDGCARLIDGLALPAFAGLPMHAVTALIHLPASLETGLPADAAQRLHATEAPMFRGVPRVVATSDQTAECLIRDFGVPHDRIAVVIPGIGDPPRCLGSAGPGCHILSAGPPIPRKGHDDLLRALGRLTDLDWTLTIAGSAGRDPACAAALRTLVRDLDLAGRVQWASEPTDALWQAADLFALMSYAEGYGVATAEALRRGLPVAVTSVGAVPVMVAPDAGVVCAVGDTEQMSKAMRRLIFDRPLRADIAAAAWQSSRDMPGWDTQAGQLADVLGAR